MGPILLVDGKNTAYRAYFATRGNREFAENGYHPFVAWLRFTGVWIQKFKPSSIHVFWDCPKNDVWRKKILTEYKNNRDGSHAYESDVVTAISKIEAASMALLPLMNTRVYRKEGQEADDLIYSASRLVAPHKGIIISSDSDMIQIPWFMSHTKQYDPKTNEFVPIPDANPIWQKALKGDEADNIEGYRGIGDVKGRQIALQAKTVREFLDVRGDQEFRRNLALIDLSLNPARLSNELYILRTMSQDVVFDKAQINAKVMELKVHGLNADFPRTVLPFKQLGVDQCQPSQNTAVITSSSGT